MTDFDHLRPIPTLPKFMSRLKVTDLDPLSVGTLPRLIEVQTAHKDGATMMAHWTGNPQLSVNDFVEARRDGNDSVWTVTGASGGTSDDASANFKNPATADLDMDGNSVIDADNLRVALTANRTYYVATTGSDSNDGLSSGSPFLTIQKAIDTVAALDLSTYDVTIDVGNGTYTATVTTKALVGAGTVTIDGDTSTPSNVVISTTSADAVRAWHTTGNYTLQGVKIQTTTSGHGIYADNQSILNVGAVEFGAVANSQIVALNQATVKMTANYTISGGATRHYDVGVGGQVVVGSVTVTISGTPTFTHFAIVYDQGAVSAYLPTFSGSITGTKYNVTMNATCRTDSDKLPGTGGSTATGGQYS